ncbi:MAG: DUF72 domain-containing protein [Chloroflexi bacterium]|nr:DUF72 domain-containing protein [Chloroflexota bacterium]
MGQTGAPVSLGTCSWTDRSLIECGRFYPPQVKTPEGRLRFYASQFPVVEVDSTYYAMPSVRNSALWAERTPPGFRFHVKAFSLFTHHPTRMESLPRELLQVLPSKTLEKGNLYARDLPEEVLGDLWGRFLQALQPLAEADRLGAVLLQFPPWFLPGRESHQYLAWCQEQLSGQRLAVEFRNASWVNERNQDRTVAFLQEQGLSFVCVDAPQGFRSSMPPLALVTAPCAYVRFHGRNADTWKRRTGVSSERFDYWYAREELQEWVPRLRYLSENAREVHVLFNTNREDQGPVNARLLMGLLQDERDIPLQAPG